MILTLALYSYYLIFQHNFVSLDFTLPLYDVHRFKIPGQESIFVQYFLGVLLIFVQAMIISRFIIKHKMSRLLSLIPGAVMVLFCVTVLQPGFTHTILLANFFFILAMGSLFEVYKVYNPIGTLFNSGFFLGCASFIYKPYSIYIFVIVLGIIALRSFKLKEILQVFLGFLCPLFLIGVFMYYNNSLNEYLDYCKISFSIPKVDFSNYRDLIKPIITIIIIIFLIFKQNALRKKKKFDAIKKVELNYWVLFFGFFTLFFVEAISPIHLLIISLPIALLSGLILENKENSITKEFVFLGFIGFYFMLIFGII